MAPKSNKQLKQELEELKKEIEEKNKAIEHLELINGELYTERQDEDEIGFRLSKKAIKKQRKARVIFMEKYKAAKSNEERELALVALWKGFDTDKYNKLMGIIDGVSIENRKKLVTYPEKAKEIMNEYWENKDLNDI